MIAISVIPKFLLVEKPDGNPSCARGSPRADFQRTARVCLDTNVTSAHYRADLEVQDTSCGQGFGKEGTGTDVDLMEWRKSSSHVSCMANALFFIQFRAAAANETAHSGTNFLCNHPGHITGSLFLCFPFSKIQPTPCHSF